MIKVYTAPELLVNLSFYNRRIFLAGSIDQGKAIEWQEEAIKLINAKLGIYGDSRICVFNPRRKDWNPDWENVTTNDSLHRQITWELQALDNATTIIMYLQPGMLSPVSLLELGMHMKKTIVVCPDGFYRKANVDIVCETYGVRMANDIKEAVNML